MEKETYKGNKLSNAISYQYVYFPKISGVDITTAYKAIAENDILAKGYFLWMYVAMRFAGDPELRTKDIIEYSDVVAGEVDMAEFEDHNSEFWSVMNRLIDDGIKNVKKKLDKTVNQDH